MKKCFFHISLNNFENYSLTAKFATDKSRQSLKTLHDFIKIYKDRDLHDLAFTAYSLQYLVYSIPCSLISL